MATTEETVRAAGGIHLTIERQIAWIRIDQPGKPVNVLSRQALRAFDDVLGELENGRGVVAAILISGKPGVWIAGADIEEFGTLGSAAEAEALSQDGHRMLARLENLPFPVLAAIDGAALGGGLEVALACTYRIATDSARTKLGLPEVQLGVLPGAGGTIRLPRLIGLRAALDLILTGKQLDARRARKIGLVDEVVPAAALQRIAEATARALADGRKQPRAGRQRGSPQWAENLPGLRQFILKKARDGVMENTGGLYPAPLRILEVVAQGLDLPFDKAAAIESRGFGELAVTPESRGLAHLFLASTDAKNDPRIEGSPKADKVHRVGIVGAGFMGAAIATVAAEQGQRVRLKDVKPEAVAKGVKTAVASVRARARKRRKPEHEITAVVDRIEGTAAYTGFRNVDLVVEAVFEDVGLKHKVLKEIEEAARPGVILASNTSTIPITTLAQAVSHPEQVLGLHFFSPVEKMPLLEIIVSEVTDPGVTATSHRWGKEIGKTPIIVNDGPGFYVNRILGPYMNEALLLVEEGVPIGQIDGAMRGWGFPVGPITLYDEVGLDVALKSGRILQEAFPDRVAASGLLPKLVEDGRLGRKNGSGFYLYAEGKKGGVDESVHALAGNPPRREMAAGEIQERLVLGMINEAVRALEDGVLRSARDGDVGAVMGFGFPPFRGGPFWFIDQVGAAGIVRRLRELEGRHGPRFAPAKLLVEHAATGNPFSE